MKEAAAYARDEAGPMLWVDQPSYYGPDRRRLPSALRLVERRRHNRATTPPPFGNALRQLRLMVIDAEGERADAFAVRAEGVAALARAHSEPEAASMLSNLATVAKLGRHRDIRAHLYNMLDDAHEALLGSY